MTSLERYSGNTNPFQWMYERLNKMDPQGNNGGMSYRTAMLMHQSHMAILDKKHEQAKELEGLQHENAKDLELHRQAAAHVLSQKAAEAQFTRTSEFHAGALRGMEHGTPYNFQMGDVRVSGTKKAKRAAKTSSPVTSSIQEPAPVSKETPTESKSGPTVTRGEKGRIVSLKKSQPKEEQPKPKATPTVKRDAKGRAVSLKKK